MRWGVGCLDCFFPLVSGLLWGSARLGSLLLDTYFFGRIANGLIDVLKALYCLCASDFL